ncbi:MAG: hypothetical protein R2862_03535 [Thermoanaerobaculia bacterium]
MGFPWRDPQFWIVTGAALVALAYVLRKRLRIRPRSGPGASNGGATGLPCDHCAQNDRHRPRSAPR